MGNDSRTVPRWRRRRGRATDFELHVRSAANVSRVRNGRSTPSSRRRFSMLAPVDTRAEDRSSARFVPTSLAFSAARGVH